MSESFPIKSIRQFSNQFDSPFHHWRIQDFPETHDAAVFHKNVYVKMKESGPLGGLAPGAPPWIRHCSYITPFLKGFGYQPVHPFNGSPVYPSKHVQVKEPSVSLQRVFCPHLSSVHSSISAK